MQNDTFILLANLEHWLTRKLTELEKIKISELLDNLPANTSFKTKQSIVNTVGQLMVLYKNIDYLN